MRSACDVVLDQLEPRRMFVAESAGLAGNQAAQVPYPNSDGDPVQIASGTLTLNTTDLQADGFGTPWGISRSWSDNPAYLVNDRIGHGWDINQNPQLVEYNYNASSPSSLFFLELVDDASSAKWFQAEGDSVGSWFNLQDTLGYDRDDDLYVLTDVSGDQTTFYGFGGSYDGYAGTFKSYKPANGSLISVQSHYSSSASAPYAIEEEQRQETYGGITTIESYDYTYNSDGYLSNVLLRRSTDGGADWTPVRQAAYTYYNSGDSFGTTGDLKTASEEDASGNILSEDYYRYNSTGQLQFEFTGPDFARLVNNQGSATAAFNASNTTVAPYATLNLSYGSYATVNGAVPMTDTWTETYTYPQVTNEVVAGMGSTDTGGAGLGTYSFTYSETPDITELIDDSEPAASDSTQYNLPAYITTETLPDGLQDTYYSNYSGLVILTIESSISDGNRYTYNQYDGNDRLASTADSSAVSGYSYDTDSGALTVTLNSAAGQITNYDYYSTDDQAANPPTETTGGAVYGYLKDVKIQQGSSGTLVETNSYDYKSHLGDGCLVYYIGDSTVYRNANGSGAETTSYYNTYNSDTLTLLATTTTWAAIDDTQNGTGSPTSDTELYDTDGNVIWEKDPNGYISYTAYNIATGAVSQTIEDVTAINDPSSPPVTLPSGWSLSEDYSLDLTTNYQSDDQGRTTREESPNGNYTYTVYDDINHETRVYPGWHYDSSIGMWTTTGPVQVERDDWANGYTESFTYAYSPTSGVTAPDGSDTIGSLLSLTRDLTNTSGQITEEDDYFNLTGVGYNTSTAHLGTLNINYYATLYAYDTGGRQDRVQSPTGTINRTVYDDFGEATSSWIGAVIGTTADDATWPTAGNMVEVSAAKYDTDGNQIETVAYPSNTSNGRATVNYYDYRDQLIAQMTGAVESPDNIGSAVADTPATDGSGITTGNDTFVTYYTLDNLGEVTQSDTYNAEGYTPTDGTTPVTGMLRTAESTASYDDQGQLYQSSIVSVSPINGSTGTAITTNYYYDADGNLIATIGATGAATKYTYNGADWLTATYTTDGGQLNNFSNVTIGSSTAYAAAASVSNDIVLTQTQDIYDNDGNVIETITKDRFGTDANTSTGSLGTATTGIFARASYATSYYDAVDRDIEDANYGTNGSGGTFLRPSNAPTGSSTILVNTTTYNPAGWVDETTDPKGIVTKYSYDALGRTTQTIADYTDGIPTDSSNQTTDYTYDGDNNQTSMTAVMPAGETSQTTTYVYGVTLLQGSKLDDNDLLYQTQYPDPTTGTNTSTGTYNQAESYTYDALGEQITYTDRNGTAHAYTYDQLGRLTLDQITAFGTSIDQTVAALGYDFTDAGQLYQAISYDAYGVELSVAQEGYDGYGNLISDLQGHYSDIDNVEDPYDEITQTVQYSYDPAHDDRQTSTTYPDGRTIDYNYNGNGGLDNVLDRITSLSDSSGTLQAYSYLGLDTPIGFTDGNGVVESSTLDSFGRIAGMSYNHSGSTIDGYDYGYDADSNVTYKLNLGLSTNSQLYAYDNLNRLTNYSAGTMNSSHGIASPSLTESWSLDATGNWQSQTINGTTTTRNSNAQNQVTNISTGTLYYDANGNATIDENGQTYIYDAWNRLVQASGGDDSVVYSYDALGRRITQTSDNHNVATDLFYSDRGQVVEQFTYGVPTAQYVWSPFYVNQLVERDEAEIPSVYSSASGYTVYSYTDDDGNVHLVEDDSTTQLFDVTLNGHYVSVDAATVGLSGSVTILATTEDAEYPYAIQTFAPDGTIVATCSSNPAFDLSDFTPTCYFINDNGDLLVGGTTNSTDSPEVVAFSGDEIDTTFGTDGITALDLYPTAIDNGDHSSIWVSGIGTGPYSGPYAAELTATGLLDTSFGLCGYASGYASSFDTTIDGNGLQRLYFEQDANYNVTSLTDASGNVVERYTYDPYGQQTVMNASGGVIAASAYNNTIGFQGETEDNNLGLVFAFMRVENINTGTWLTEDPAGAAGSGNNLYQLDDSNPVGLTDPSGLSAASAITTGAANVFGWLTGGAQVVISAGPQLAYSALGTAAEIANNTVDFTVNAAAGYVSTSTLAPPPPGPVTPVGAAGQKAGELAATAQGVAEMMDGGSGMAGGGLLLVGTEGLGAPATVAIDGLSAAALVHGTALASKGLKNLGTSPNVHNSTPLNGGGNQPQPPAGSGQSNYGQNKNPPAQPTDGGGAAANNASAPRTHGDLVNDFKNNPGDWERTSTQVGETPSGKNAGQTNVETQWRNTKTGDTLSTHEVGGPNNPHPENVSPNLPEGGAIRPGNRAKELR